MANATAIIIYNQDKILLQKRDTYAKKNPNLWGFFGGSLKDNEEPLEGIKREVFEELTYQLREPKLFFEIDLKNDGKKLFFVEHYDTNQPLLLKEGEGMRWFTAEELKNIQIVPHHQVALFHFLDKKSSRDVHESAYL